MTISNSDKLTIIEGKIKSSEYSLYSVEIDLQLENANTEKDQEAIDVLNTRISDINAKLSILNTEKAKLE